MTKEKSFAPCASKKTQMCISIDALVVAYKLNHISVCFASQFTFLNYVVPACMFIKLQCTLLSFCSLSELGLTHIPSKLLQQLPNLEDLDLSLNKLTAIENEGALPQVKKLSFAGNQLSSTDGLTAFPNLENVNVTDNPTLEVKVFIFVCV